jgi:hypothetical protein
MLGLVAPQDHRQVPEGHLPVKAGVHVELHVIQEAAGSNLDTVNPARALMRREPAAIE